MERVDRPIARKVAPLAVAAEIAVPQHGVVARRQLLRAGLSRDAIDHLVVAGRLLPLHRGVHAAGHRPVGMRSREMAVVLIAGVQALSWHSALALRAMRRPWHGSVHASGKHSRVGSGFVIHRTRRLPAEDVTTHWGIPVTTPLRTLLDLSRTLSLDALDAALADIVLATAGWLTVRVTDHQLTATGAETAERFGRLLSRRAW